MKDARKKKLKKAGWKVASASDFLGLSDEETAFIELKLLLAQSVREHRERKGLTQNALAVLMGSSHSRVAKMEGGRCGRRSG